MIGAGDLREPLLRALRTFMPSSCVPDASSDREGKKALHGSSYLTPAAQPWWIISAEKSIESWPHRDSVPQSLVPSSKVLCT